MLGITARPKSFKEVIGQDTIVKALRNQIRGNTVPEVLLFLGPAGVGKNTLAEILASTLNCENPGRDDEDSRIPCGECAHCKQVASRRSGGDYLFLNGVKADDLEVIEDALTYAPHGNSTIVVLNEFHESAIKVINKFKEIFERVQDNVHFLVTSSDPDLFKNMGNTNSGKDREKTALGSRISPYTLKLIPEKLIREHLFSILEKEDPEGEIPETIFGILSLISENSKGCLREAVNRLGQLLDSKIYTEKEAREILGYVDEKEMFQVTRLLARKDVKALSLISEKGYETSHRYLMTALGNICYAKVEGFDDLQEWQVRNAQEVLSTGNLDALMQTLMEVKNNCRFGFEDSVFKYYLYLYFQGVNTTKVSSLDLHPLSAPTVEKKQKIRKEQS